MHAGLRRQWPWEMSYRACTANVILQPTLAAQVSICRQAVIVILMPDQAIFALIILWSA